MEKPSSPRKRSSRPLRNGVPPQKVVTFEYPIPFETGKRYKVNSSLLYQMEGRPEQLVASWNGEIEGGK
jgi:predicted transcriptional regulator